MDAMGWLAWLIVGAVSGWLASMVMRTNQGIVMDIIVGIVGAFVGGFLFNLLGAPGATGFNVYSVIVAFIGAVVLLGILRMFSRNAPPAV